MPQVWFFSQLWKPDNFDSKEKRVGESEQELGMFPLQRDIYHFIQCIYWGNTSK